MDHRSFGAMNVDFDPTVFKQIKLKQKFFSTHFNQNYLEFTSPSKVFVVFQRNKLLYYYIVIMF